MSRPYLLAQVWHNIGDKRHECAHSCLFQGMAFLIVIVMERNEPVMKTVTQAYIRRGQQAELELDGETRVMVDRKTWEESSYRVGSSLSENELERLLDQSRRARAREKALYLLSQRDYSRKGLAEKLMREKGRYQADREQAAHETAARMEELGLINDEAYARRLAADCQRRLFPKRRTLQELQAKGIDRETARMVVEELEIPDGQLALELLRKRYYNRLHTPEDRHKTTAALVRYGFGYEDIRRAFRAMDLELRDDEPETGQAPGDGKAW